MRGTIIHGNGTDRIFGVLPGGPIAFDLPGVTVRNGESPSTGFTAAGVKYLSNVDVTITGGAIPQTRFSAT